MTILEAVSADLMSRGFTPGLIQGAAHLSHSLWREIERISIETQNRGQGASQGALVEALVIANEIARDLDRVRHHKALRRHEFFCPNERHYFDEFFTYNTYDDDARAAVNSATSPCPKCGAPCQQVMRTAPGVSFGRWGVVFGGQIHDKEELDAKLDESQRKEKTKRFFDSPDFAENFLGRFEETAVKTMAGEIPSPPTIDPSVANEVVSQIVKGV